MAKDYTIAYLLDLYGPVLTEKQRVLMDCYYNDDLSLSEISENEGITRQGARDGIKRAEGQLRSLEEKLGLLRKSREQAAEAAKIRAAAAEAAALVEQGAGESRVLGELQKIDRAAQRLQDGFAPGV